MDTNAPVIQEPQDLMTAVMQEGLLEPLQDDSFTWSAGRFVAHKKSLQWYAIFILVALVVTAGIYLITKDVVTVGTFIIVAIVFIASAMHKPKRLKYTLDGDGVRIGKKVYFYEDFRAFSITDEGNISCIYFRPLQTFVPQITVYYDRKDEARIADILLGRLPLEEYRPDWINWLLDRVRF